MFLPQEIWYKIKKYESYIGLSKNIDEMIQILNHNLAMPYYFSDHKNKSFESQFKFILREYPHFWKIFSDKYMQKTIYDSNEKIRTDYN